MSIVSHPPRSRLLALLRHTFTHSAVLWATWRAATRPGIIPCALVLVIAVTSGLAGCNIHYGRGQALEAANRWEEAAISYRLAVIDDPDDAEYRKALQRANKVVARENYEVYRRYLAEKQFKKAYARLLNAHRQDAAYPPLQKELKKWQQVLVAGQVSFVFSALRRNLTLADEIGLVVRLNTPNPGDVIEAEIDLDSGLFFTEDLLYDRPPQMLTFYTLRAIGVSVVYGRNQLRKFSSKEFRRFVNYRTPVLDGVEGGLAISSRAPLRPVAGHQQRRSDILSDPVFSRFSANPHYALRLEGARIRVNAPRGNVDFTPRFLYFNPKHRRIFVDFGRYELKQQVNAHSWRIRRLPLAEQDYFPLLKNHIVLRPYFFYTGKAVSYLSLRSSSP